MTTFQLLAGQGFFPRSPGKPQGPRVKHFPKSQASSEGELC